jgi:serine/threonine protein kinase
VTGARGSELGEQMESSTSGQHRAMGGTARAVGPYLLHAEIASGGMATIHLGTEPSSSRVVAIKRLHAQFAKDPDFVAMFLDETRVARRIDHPNVIRVLDVVHDDGELFLIMEHVLGSPLSMLLRRASATRAAAPPHVVASIFVGVLHGLHAAHESRDEEGGALGVVHRDVSPQNVLVGLDGKSRVFDFGIAKAAGRIQTSQRGQLKGKLSYMAPEQLQEDPVSRRTDVYAASVVLWEALAGRRLFAGADERGTMAQVLAADVAPPSHGKAGLTEALDRVVLRGLDRDPDNRFATAREMAHALADACRPASAAQVAAWVTSLAGKELAHTARLVAALGGRGADAKQVSPALIEVETTVPAGARRRAAMLALAAVVELAALATGAWLSAERTATTSNALEASKPTAQATKSLERRAP